MSRHSELPSQGRLIECLKYEPETGRLYWRRSGFGVTVGRRAGSEAGKGYRRVKIDKRLYLEHRVIFKMLTGKDPASKEVDHINGNPADNRIENLRLASRNQNRANGKAYRNNGTGFRGVHYHKQHHKYTADIQFEGNKRFLGLFACPKQAARAYDKAAREMFGAFAKTNFKEALNGDRA